MGGGGLGVDLGIEGIIVMGEKLLVFSYIVWKVLTITCCFLIANVQIKMQDIFIVPAGLKDLF